MFSSPGFLSHVFFMFNFNTEECLISVKNPSNVKANELHTERTFFSLVFYKSSSIPIQGNTTVPVQKEERKKNTKSNILFVYDGSLGMVSGQSATCISFSGLHVY